MYTIYRIRNMKQIQTVHYGESIENENTPSWWRLGSILSIAEFIIEPVITITEKFIGGRVFLSERCSYSFRLRIVQREIDTLRLTFNKYNTNLILK
jgi:hypothetical protein